MAEDGNGRKDLYRKLYNDPATREGTKKYSFNQWEQKLAESPDALAKIGAYAIEKKWASDFEDFSNKYAAGLNKPQAFPPAPKPQAAPVAPAPVEEEPYVPEPPPAIGSPEYDAQLQAQYGGMSPTLGATFGGAPAAFETKAQKKQEQISPAFKAQQLAFEDVPIAEEQRRAQRQFAKATKERQQAALMGGPGFEEEQKKRKKERGYGEWGEDVVGSWVEGGKRIGKNILSTVGYFAQTQAATDPMANLPYEKRQEMMQQASQTMYDNATAAQNTFQNEIAKRNIQTSVLQAINKGDYSRLPESVLYTVGDAAMQIIPSILTFGGSTYAQTLPQVYKDGVDAIAKEKGISPEQAIANGDDAFVVSQINAGVQSALEYAGAGLVSKGIASKGGYKAMRDWLLGQNVNRRLAQGAALLGVGTGEAATEYGQELTGQIGKTAAKSPTTKAFLDKLPNEIFTPEARNQRAEAFVGGLVGGLGLTGGGQAIQSAMDRTLFEAPKIGKATQRPDMDVVQTDNKITERNKIAQAMEEAVKANPEAAGQIRQQYQKRINEAAPTDEEVLSAYESLSVLPETEEKNAIRENLEAYMAEKGIAPEAEVETVSAEELQGPGFQIAYAKTREEIPQEYRGTIAEVERPTTRLGRFGPMERLFAYRVPTETIDITAPEAVTEEDIAEEIPFEEVPAEEVVAPPEEEDEALAAFGRELEAIEQAAPVAPAEEVVTEKVPAEPIAPEVADIESRRQDTESKIKRKDLFSDGGVFANTLGGSGVDSVPTQHREINGIEFVEFSNPNTGVVDVVMTGTSDRDFVGFYRLYENGKPTNKWSSKFENQSRNKENFKTMLSGVQEMLPDGHEYTEKTSISTDGLRVWNQQLSKGYELQYDENGNLVTNRVAINGDAIVNELGIPVEAGDFNNIRVSNKKDFETVKKVLLPYLEKFGLGEKNIYMTNGTVEIDLPVLRKIAPQAAPVAQAEEVVSAAPVEEAPVVAEEEVVEAVPAPAPKAKKERAPKAALVTPPAAPKVEPVAEKPQPKKEEKTIPKEEAKPIGSLKDVKLTMRRPDKNEIIFVSADALLKQHAKDQPSYDIQNIDNRIKGRVEKAKKFLQDYLKDQRAINPKTGERMKTKISFEPSLVDVLDNGKISFEDGRHRVLAAKELGISEVPIEVPRQNARAIKELLEKGAEPKAETKPSTETPQEGSEVSLPPQSKYTTEPRKMVFRDGEWKQNVGGDMVKVGPAVQQQAQEAFAGKEETKPAETKFKPIPNATYYISKGADEVYYTLREIVDDDFHVHVMNLSKDLEESKRKAKELIGEDVEFDETSLGRDYNKIRADKTGKGRQLAKRLEGEGIAATLTFGKYYGKTIDEIFEIDPSYILYLNREYFDNTVFQKGVRDNLKIKEFIEQSLADKEQQRKNLESLTEIGGVKFDDKGVAKTVPIKGKIKYINNRMGPQGFYKVYILDTEYGVPVEVSGDIGKYVDGKLEQGAELSFTANVQKVGDKFKVIGRKSEYTKPAETKEGKNAEAKEEKGRIPEEPTKKGVRFEKGKKLTEEEKKEVYKNLKDSYKEMKRPYTIETRVSQYTGRDYEARVWLENASDYMQTSDVTGRKLRYYIFLPDGTLAHPTEIFPNISPSEMTRVQRNVEYNERQANEKMDDITSQLKKSGEIDKVVKAIETALKNGAEFVKEYDSGDVGQKNPLVMLRFPNGRKWGVPQYVINTQDSILGFTQKDVVKDNLGESREKIFDTNYQPDWEQFYNNNKQAEAQPEAAPSFTSQQSSGAATAFDKAKTSKGFDKKYGKGAYKALSDITKNFEDIMDKVSEKIKQDCIV